MTIRSPAEWGGAQLLNAAHAAGSAYRSLHHIKETMHSPAPAVRHIGVGDVRDALARGFADFEAHRTDVIFMGTVYAAAGLLIGRFAFGMDLIPLLFPLASGFALIGPIAAIGLYEMSKRREEGVAVNWMNALDVVKAPAIGAIAVLSLMLTAVFVLWLVVAWEIWQKTLGPTSPVSFGAFAHDVFFTPAGLAMIVIGTSVGFVFALFAMMLSVVSFPLLIDRDVGLDTAIKTSFRAVFANPVPMALWGLIVAVSLAAGSALMLMGLIVVVPVLGHSTWHLYRKLVR